MTDKQIIIDGVEVKDCIAYAKSQEIYLGDTLYKQTEKVCMVKNQPCKFFDCQFKQMARELDQLKSEVKSKTEYIQEQREIIDQYSKEIEMYKKCQGKRASKREEELKAENEQLKNFHINLVGVKECEIKELAELKADNKHLNDLLNQALKELEQSREAFEKIKEICQIKQSQSVFVNETVFEQILQICDEVKK